MLKRKLLSINLKFTLVFRSFTLLVTNIFYTKTSLKQNVNHKISLSAGTWLEDREISLLSCQVWPPLPG